LETYRVDAEGSFEVELGDVTGAARIPVTLSSGTVEVPEAVGGAAPAYVLAAGGGLAYGDLRLPDVSRQWLIDHLPDLPSALSRGAAWGTLWEEMLEGRVAPETLADLARRAVAREPDELNLQRLLSDLERLSWRFLSPEARADRSAALEDTLRTGLAHAETPSVRRAWFETLSRVATSADAIAWLTAVWRGDEELDGVPLSAEDQTDLAFELAVREAPDWRAILDTQAERITNPDQQARFAFIVPALDADPDVRRQFFASLASAESRRREPWVLTALGFLHHPLRAGSSVDLIRPALDLLVEVQRTGDIFFPSRWMDATLAGHRTPAAAGIVEAFLADHPAYPAPLRQIILQAADDLLRLARGQVGGAPPLV